MHSARSAYAALGLEPDAEPGDIDRAYKRLIKLHHPDRDGGDAAKAAELNRAYRELRGRRPPEQSVEFHEPEPVRKRRTWVPAAIVLVLSLAAIALVVARWNLVPGVNLVGSGRGRGREAAAGGSMSAPIGAEEIRLAVRDALRMANARDDEALLDTSRECHRRLRARPSIAQFDRCAAFEDAIVQLQNRDPLWDEGPFGAPAVSRRLWAAASLLSNDYLAIDSRLDRIRVAVELQLAPRPPQSPG